MKHQPQTKNTSHKEQSHKLEKKESHKEQKYQLQKKKKPAKKQQHFSHTEKVHQPVKHQTQRTREQLQGEKEQNPMQQVNSSSRKTDSHGQMAAVRLKVDPKQRCKLTSKCTNTSTCRLHMHVP